MQICVYFTRVDKPHARAVLQDRALVLVQDLFVLSASKCKLQILCTNLSFSEANIFGFHQTCPHPRHREGSLHIHEVLGRLFRSIWSRILPDPHHLSHTYQLETENTPVVYILQKKHMMNTIRSIWTGLPSVVLQ